MNPVPDMPWSAGWACGNRPCCRRLPSCNGSVPGPPACVRLGPRIALQRPGEAVRDLHSGRLSLLVPVDASRGRRCSLSARSCLWCSPQAAAGNAREHVPQAAASTPEGAPVWQAGAPGRSEAARGQGRRAPAAGSPGPGLPSWSGPASSCARASAAAGSCEAAPRTGAQRRPCRERRRSACRQLSGCQRGCPVRLLLAV